MTTMAVISDVHANPFALDAVLKSIRRHGMGEVECLGDLVGHNMLPQETLRLLRDTGIPSVKGNHDMMASGELPIAHCGPNARRSLLWTRDALTDDERHYLQTLAVQRQIRSDTLLLHSRLGDPVRYLRGDDEYLVEHDRIRARHPGVRLCFTGHTHVGQVVEITPRRQIRHLSSRRTTLDADCFYFINPGSVGHPRRSDYRAAYAILEDSRRVHLLRAPYARGQMQIANLRHQVGTDLGPGILRHRLRHLVATLKRWVRP